MRINRDLSAHFLSRPFLNALLILLHLHSVRFSFIEFHFEPVCLCARVLFNIYLRDRIFMAPDSSHIIIVALKSITQ
jgi:hypothetical protein